jgi:tRNA A37 threonylcarbamoyladenosine modification protein TsaB
MHKKKVDIVVIALSTPVKIGVYENNNLLDEIISEEKSSEFLPVVFKELLENYNINSITYTNTPGSFMSIKVAYIFLKSFCILNDIELLGVEGFYFNQNKPIKAIGKLYFVKIQDKIETKKFDEVLDVEFKLPKTIDKNKFNKDNKPIYVIGAV